MSPVFRYNMQQGFYRTGRSTGPYAFKQQLWATLSPGDDLFKFFAATFPVGICLQVDRQHARKGNHQAGDAHGWATTCRQCKHRVRCDGVVLCGK